jgi:imidazolonepropionase-like amidohydrolase
MLLIKNGKVVTMAGPTYEKGCILIDNKKIIKVGHKINTDENDVSEVIDASNCWVLPGLIESHCHVGIIEERKGFEGDDCNEKNEPITPYLKAIDAINPMDIFTRTMYTIINGEIVYRAKGM